MNLLAEITSTLDAAGIPYALIGALALSAHGVNRATLDLDLLVVDDSCLKGDFWAALESRGVAVEIRKGDLSDPLAGVVRFELADEESIDVVVGKFGWQRRILERAEPVDAIPLVGRADLVLLKLYAGGPQDAWDVQQLLARFSGMDLIQQVEPLLAELPERCSELWHKILKG